MLIKYLSITGYYLPEYNKQATWDLLHVYIDAHSQMLIDEYPRGCLQAITILQSQCENMNFSDKSRYNWLFHKVVHQGGGSEINYINTLKDYKTLEISVGNSYSEYQLIQTLFYNLQKEVRCLYQIAIHKS